MHTSTRAHMHAHTHPHLVLVVALLIVGWCGGTVRDGEGAWFTGALIGADITQIKHAQHLKAHRTYVRVCVRV